MMHLIYAQVEAAVPGGWNTVLFGYGPLGTACVWLARLVEKMREEHKGRDAMIREISDKQSAALGSVAHKISGLSRALVYNAATHADGAVRDMARKEMEKWRHDDSDPMSL